MKSMSVLVATAEQEIFRGDAAMLIAPSMQGELAIMPGHAPLLAILRPGEVRVDCPVDGSGGPCKSTDVVVFGGFLEVQPDAVIILADAIERAEDIDVAKARKAAENARRLISSPDKEVAVKALLDLEVAIAKLRVARRNSKESFLKPSRRN